MPALTEYNVRHLLRRTEFVDRPARVAELMALGSMEAAVDNVLAVPSDPPSADIGNGHAWEQGQRLVHHWYDRMAHDSPRPLQEKMAVFWHGHFVSEAGKVNSGPLMQEQIDLFRNEGLGNVRDIAHRMSTQVAMLRYLDNNQNVASSPNQNFARELMELFLLGVGNYTEADVESATAAWTGHGDDWTADIDAYRWRPDEHDGSVKSFLGRTINQGGDPQQHGAETIDVILGNGLIPTAADQVANRGRRSRVVAAEFLSRKLWTHFATTSMSSGMQRKLSNVLLANDFAIRPWLRSMLLSSTFYGRNVREGMVRSPVEWIAAMLYHTGLRSEAANLLWLTDGMGQSLLYPPNVAGWKTNGYFVNASAMGNRAGVCQMLRWVTGNTYWNEDGLGAIELRNGRLTLAELTATDEQRNPVMNGSQVVDRMLELTDIRLTGRTRRELGARIDTWQIWERDSALIALLLAPELHVA